MEFFIKGITFDVDVDMLAMKITELTKSKYDHIYELGMIPVEVEKMIRDSCRNKVISYLDKLDQELFKIQIDICVNRMVEKITIAMYQHMPLIV